MNPHARLNTQYSGASSRRTALPTSVILGSSVSAASPKSHTAEKGGYEPTSTAYEASLLDWCFSITQASARCEEALLASTFSS